MKVTGKKLAAAGLVLYLGACVTLSMQRPYETTQDRGLKFPHDPHVEGLDCTTCHDFGAEERTVFNHEFCGICHEIPEEQPTEQACAYCHTRPDYSVTPRTSILLADLRFDHVPHLEQELDCTVCHPNPDTNPMPRGRLKPFCMDCHGATEPRLNECSVCHQVLDTDVIPEFRAGMRLAHDSPEVWMRIHGRESRIDPMYCAQCHDQRQNDCQQCHSVTRPDNHTASWMRRMHGLQATWNRQNCMACHEEDSCMQCHQNTRPASHRGRFGRPVNTHCVQCHFPPQTSSCTVCHETIEHRSARPSPHLLGIYPPDCSQCHPGGLPTRAPHLHNSSVRCIVCHR